MKHHGTKKAEPLTLSEELHAALTEQARRHAALIIAEQAELFAVQFAGAVFAERGASDALRLFAALLRETTQGALPPIASA